jgi:nitrile hydratase
MDGIHDLGGLQGFGAIEVERDEPVFHTRWEGRVFGMVGIASVQRITQIDRFRHAIERMDPAHYLSSPYYEHWLAALTTLLVEKDIVSRDELASPGAGDVPLARPATGPRHTGESAGGHAPFAVGDRVRVRDLHTSGHTRCPRYVRGRRGVVVRVDHNAPLPDHVAHGLQAREEPTYSVRFDPVDLRGDDAEPGPGSVVVDRRRDRARPRAHVLRELARGARGADGGTRPHLSSRSTSSIQSR